MEVQDVDQHLRDLQQEYLEFLDDEVKFLCVFISKYKLPFLFIRKTKGPIQRRLKT